MKFTEYDKLSKKKKSEINSKKRGNWGGINPVTKVVQSKKVYTRKEKHSQKNLDDIDL